MYDIKIEKLKLVLQNLEKATDLLRDIIENAEMPEAIITLLTEKGSQKQDFIASAMGVGIRDLNDVLRQLKRNGRVTIKGKIGTSSCIISTEEKPKKKAKSIEDTPPIDKEKFLGDLKRLEDILAATKERI